MDFALDKNSKDLDISMRIQTLSQLYKADNGRVRACKP